jgi:hypothetical protein
MATFTKEIIEAAISGFEVQREHIDSQIAELRAMLRGGTPARTDGDGDARAITKRRFSAAARQRMREAQQRRWAKVRNGSSAGKSAATPKRKLSASGRKAIVAAQKKRWAEKKAAAVKPAAKNVSRRKEAPSKTT